MRVWDTASPAPEHTTCLTATDKGPDISECAWPFQIKFAGEAHTSVARYTGPAPLH